MISYRVTDTSTGLRYGVQARTIQEARERFLLTWPNVVGPVIIVPIR